MLVEISQVLSPQDLDRFQDSLSDANWVSGADSAGDHARSVKSNEEMEQSDPRWAAINETVVSRLLNNPNFQSAVLPARVSAAFVARYTEGMAYGPHVDDPVMGALDGRYRADVAVTVFISDADSYTGGELSINTRFGPANVKLPAGSAVAYPASSLHEVTPVTQGERIVCVLWVQSLVRDPSHREILADLDDARRALQQATPTAQVTKVVDRSYINLVRLWAEP